MKKILMSTMLIIGLSFNSATLQAQDPPQKFKLDPLKIASIGLRVPLSIANIATKIIGLVQMYQNESSRFRKVIDKLTIIFEQLKTQKPKPADVIKIIRAVRKVVDYVLGQVIGPQEKALVQEIATLIFTAVYKGDDKKAKSTINSIKDFANGIILLLDTVDATLGVIVQDKEEKPPTEEPKEEAVIDIEL